MDLSWEDTIDFFWPTGPSRFFFPVFLSFLPFWLSTSSHDVRRENLVRSLAWERVQLPAGYGKQRVSTILKLKLTLYFLPFLTHFLLNKDLKSRKVYYFARQNQHFNFNCRGSLIWKSRQLTKVTCSCLKICACLEFFIDVYRK